MSNLACFGRNIIAWVSGRADSIWADLPGRAEPIRIAVAGHGGTFGPPRVSSSWLLAVEYILSGGDSNAVSGWWLTAVDLNSGETTALASESDARDRELPMPDVEGNIAVWDELTSSDHKALYVENLANKQRRMLNVPASE